MVVLMISGTEVWDRLDSMVSVVTWRVSFKDPKVNLVLDRAAFDVADHNAK